MESKTKKTEEVVKKVEQKVAPKEEVQPILEIKLLNSESKTPVKVRETDAGFDLFAAEDVELLPNERRVIGTGIAMHIPEGYYGRIADRSSIAARGIIVSGGVVDSEYRGEVKIILTNIKGFVREFEEYEFKGENLIKEEKIVDGAHTIKKGNKIAQIIIEKIGLPKVVVVKELSKSNRGSKGFGSSGE